jgi:hypothetical protein
MRSWFIGYPPIAPNLEPHQSTPFYEPPFLRSIFMTLIIHKLQRSSTDWLLTLKASASQIGYSSSVTLNSFRSSLSKMPVYYEGVSKSFRTGHLERELQMVQLSATRCSYIAILWLSRRNFAAITLCAASQRVPIVYFVIYSVWKLLDIPSYI